MSVNNRLAFFWQFLSKARAGKGLSLSVLMLVAAVLYGCAETKLDTASGRIMGTTYHIKWNPQGVEVSAETIQVNIHKLLEQVDQLMSTYKENSELSRFNRSAIDHWFQLSPDTLEVFKVAASVNQQSEGAFDITVGELVNLWGFGPDFRPTEIPSVEKIKEKLKNTGTSNLLLNEDTGKIKKMRPVYVDLSAVAKGFAVDKVADYLGSVGATGYLVEVGGELRSQGYKPDGSPWKVAIELPVAGDRQVHSVLEPGSMGLATSGDYRNFFEENGVRYSHMIDPRTGRPAAHNLASVTVLHKRAAFADAWATAFMVLGEKQGYAVAVEQNLAVLFITNSNGRIEELVTPAFKSTVRVVEE